MLTKREQRLMGMADRPHIFAVRGGGYQCTHRGYVGRVRHNAPQAYHSWAFLLSMRLVPVMQCQ